MSATQKTPVEMAQAIIFATTEANRIFGPLVGGTTSPLNDAAVVAQAMLDLFAVAKAYEQWEADLILSDAAWKGELAALPTLPQVLWDRLLEIQAMRNAAIAKATASQP